MVFVTGPVRLGISTRLLGKFLVLTAQFKRDGIRTISPVESVDAIKSAIKKTLRDEKKSIENSKCYKTDMSSLISNRLF